MKFIADLHLHSKFSRATSKDMTFDILAYWGKVKGIRLLATGDFTHPEWLFLMKEKLETAGNGFLRFRNGIQPPENPNLRSVAVSDSDAHSPAKIGAVLVTTIYGSLTGSLNS